MHAQHFAEYMKRFGSSGSVALFDPACKIFKLPSVEGIIGFRDDKGCAVVFGDPLCHPHDIPELVHAFHDSCKKENKGVLYATSSPRFALWALEHVCEALIEFGEELYVDPNCDPTVGAPGRKLRNKVNSCTNAGVTVHEYLGSDPQLELQLNYVAEKWLNARKGLQIYLAHVNLFENPLGKRWFYAKKGSEVVGVILLNKMQKGWILNLLMTTPQAPHGTSELLVVKLLEKLRYEGCQHLSFGAVPSEKGLGQVEGFNAFSSWVAKKGYKVAKKVFNLGGRKTFWKKFQPFSEPSYLLFSRSRIGITEIKSILGAFNVGLKGTSF